LDLNNDGYLNLREFSEGMITLFTESFDEIEKFIFRIYDNNRDGKINREDIRMLFQYIPLNSKFDNYSFKRYYYFI